MSDRRLDRGFQQGQVSVQGIMDEMKRLVFGIAGIFARLLPASFRFACAHSLLLQPSPCLSVFSATSSASSFTKSHLSLPAAADVVPCPASLLTSVSSPTNSDRLRIIQPRAHIHQHQAPLYIISGEDIFLQQTPIDGLVFMLKATQEQMDAYFDKRERYEERTLPGQVCGRRHY